MTGSYSDTVGQMQLMSDPGALGSEVLATSLAEELEHIRFQLRAITGESQWYVPPSQSLGSIGGIGDNSVPLTKLSNTTQGKLMGRVAAGAGPWQEFDIPGLTALVPVTGDLILGVPAAGGAPRKIDIKDLISTSVSAQGRLTLAPGIPCMNNQTFSAKNTIYYTPYTGLFVPVWNGSIVIPSNMGAELLQLTTDNTKSPAAALANKNYDIFYWVDGTTPRISRGPPWTSDTVRGAGAGTSEVTRVAGLLVNAQAITNGPAQFRGTYLGTIRTDSSALINYLPNPVADGGGWARIGVWNFYNQIGMVVVNKDSHGSYNGLGATGFYGGSANNRVSIVRGLDNDVIDTRLSAYASVGVGCSYSIGSCIIPGTTTLGGDALGILVAASDVTVAGTMDSFTRYSGAGWIEIQAVDQGLGSGPITTTSGHFHIGCRCLM